MEVEACEYRKTARIVAITHTILFGLAMFGYLILLGTGIVPIVSIFPTITEDHDVSLMITGIVIYLLGIQFLFTIVHFWGTWYLCKATRMGNNILEALPRALTCRNGGVVSIIIGVVYGIASRSWGLLAFSLLIHSIMIYFVQKFISEMQRTLESGKYDLPTHIVPSGFGDNDSCSSLVCCLHLVHLRTSLVNC